jgi:hypothetical protein
MMWIIHLLNKVAVLKAAVKVGRNEQLKQREHDARQNQGQG